jgi:cellulose synthase/poly-beta-1,6-N-acetylglucosamine synthase-like glycosyltransferase
MELAPTFRIISVVVQLMLGYNLVLPVILYIMRMFKKRKRLRKVSEQPVRDYAIIVTAYEQTDAVPAAVASILKLNYSKYIIYVVADKCDVSNLRFDDPRVVVLRPPETLASNTRSHFYAINNFVRDHDVLTIIDSDNLVDPEYLHQLDNYFNRGFLAVQGVRKPKNLDSTFACLDAARDIYYHFFDGKILFDVGSSATLAGSGMAFTTALYRECLEHLDISGAGFDKVLQYEIVRRGHRIAFNERAIVYDEKTSRPEVLVKQRARWINTWFKYSRYGISLSASGVRSLNINKLLFGVVLLRPPLFIFLILSMFCMVVNGWYDPTACLLWMAGFSFFTMGFFISFMHSNPDKRIVKSLVNIPRFMFYQVLSLLIARKANKVSVATRHYDSTNINDIA